MMYQSPIYVYGYFFGLTFLPIILLALSYRPTDLGAIYRWTFLLLVTANLALVLHALTANSFAAEMAFAGRVEVAGDLAQTAVLNPLTLGINGAMLCAFVIGFLTTSPVLPAWTRAVALGLLALGGANILFSASRGPALAFALVVMVTIYTLVRGALGLRAVKVRASTWVYLAALLCALLALAFQSQI